MGTEDETGLTMQGRATAAAGAALVAACIVNPLDVIKVGNNLDAVVDAVVDADAARLGMQLNTTHSNFSKCSVLAIP